MDEDVDDDDDDEDEDEDDELEEEDGEVLFQYNVGIDMDDMDFLEGITSCNKVENVVMLSEYEQNLSKEKEDNSDLPGQTNTGIVHDCGNSNKRGAKKGWSVRGGLRKS